MLLTFEGISFCQDRREVSSFHQRQRMISKKRKKTAAMLAVYLVLLGSIGGSYVGRASGVSVISVDPGMVGSRPPATFGPGEAEAPTPRVPRQVTMAVPGRSNSSGSSLAGRNSSSPDPVQLQEQSLNVSTLSEFLF